MPKTVFQNGTIVAAEFLNKIFGGNANAGHVHDGANEDGSAPKININDHTHGTLAADRLAPHRHNGAKGQQQKIDLATEVTGVLPLERVEASTQITFKEEFLLSGAAFGPRKVSIYSEPVAGAPEHTARVTMVLPELAFIQPTLGGGGSFTLVASVTIPARLRPGGNIYVQTKAFRDGDVRDGYISIISTGGNMVNMRFTVTGSALTDNPDWKLQETVLQYFVSA